jgi:MtrB/PioB family decaheme-associated outer membrane protein
MLLTPCPAAAGPGQEPQTAPPAAPAPAPQAAAATTEFPVGGNVGHVDVGFRSESVSGDAARFNRFRDTRQGPTIDSFRLVKETESWAFLGEAHNAGYRDQRFSGELNAIGRLKVGFRWDQIPLFISRDTRSLQTNAARGVLSVDDTVQRGIENRTMTLADAIAGAKGFDMRSRRHVAAVDVAYSANRDVDVLLRVTNTERRGTHLQSFGLLNSPGGGIAQELGIPMDTRTTDVKAAVEFANSRGMASAGLTGSWFDNRIPTVQFDNPLRFTDISAGPSRGLAVMWPSSSLVSFVANGAYKLPARTRATAAISIGRADQNEPLAPASINAALVAPPLERARAEARADVVSMVYSLNSKPSPYLWLNARYRYYDYANKTPLFDTVAVVGDWAVGTAQWESEPLSVKRQNMDVDASVTPHRFVALGAGYSHEASDRTYRVFERTAEDTLRVSVDSTATAFFTARLKYEFSRRTGSGLDEALLEEVGEQPEMRHYDIADRDRSRVTGLVTVTPVGWLAVNASLGTGRDDYRNTGFGLRDNRNRSYGFGADVSPAETISVGVSYEREKYTANQYSRTAVPAGTASGPNEFFDSRRDWWTDTNDRVHTLSATVDLLKTIPRTEIRVSYDLSDGRAPYVYGTQADAPRVTIANLESAVPVPQQLAPLTNRITDGRLDVQYFIRSNIAIGAVYWYEAYRVDDFSLNSTVINTLAIGTGTVYSGYLYRPYTAHTGWLKLSYLW